MLVETAEHFLAPSFVDLPGWGILAYGATGL